MIRFSANLTMLFPDVDFLDRFERAAKAGFKAVEYMFPYPCGKDDLSERLRKYGLQQVLFNLPAGDWAAGDRGIACLPGREGEFRNGVGLAIEYAKALGCPLVNCLVGNVPVGAPDKAHRTLIDNLRFASAALEKERIRFLVEPLNLRDMPGFYLCGTGNALKLIEEVNHPNLWLQYDIYHMQVTEGNLMQTIQENFKRIAHIQIADNPGRNEPGTGEINFPNIFRFLDKMGYTGWIGCEYKPLGKTEDGLTWMKPYR
jgi:hydroxypyruvate isomerase